MCMHSITIVIHYITEKLQCPIAMLQPVRYFFDSYHIYNSYTANRDYILNQAHSSLCVPGFLKSLWCAYVCVYVVMCVCPPLRPHQNFLQ